MSTVATRACPNCGTDNPVAQKFCGNCGGRLDVAPLPEERRWATVLFADVSGFTALSEKMDPEDVGDLARRAVRRFSTEVVKYGGTVVREFGDEVLAIFGVPMAHEDDPERAVRAALAIARANIEGPQGPLGVHAGINTGEVISTQVNLGNRDEHAIHGDAVNTAARLRAAAPAGSVLVGQETWRATRESVRYRELAPIDAKGKDQPVPTWEALDVAAVPRARSLGDAPLVGRADELALLTTIWTKVERERRPHLVTILGEPGIGKSRLAVEFEGRIGDGALCLHGRCAAYGEALGYQALNTALREAAGIDERDDTGAARAKIDALVRRVLSDSTAGDDAVMREVADHMALLVGFARDAGSSRADAPTLYASLRRVIEGLGRERPLVLSIEDLHWADEPLLDILEHVASRVRNVALLVLTQARPALLEARPAWGRGVRAFTTVSLEPLDESESRELVRALADQRGLSRELAEGIGPGAGGNPLYVEELVAMLAERGAAAEIPSAIKALISARIDALSAEERSVMQRAAVFGKTFWQAGLSALGAPAALDAVLDALEQKELVRAQPRSRFPGDREFVLKHDLTRDVAYEMLLKVDRRRLHGAIVDWIERVVGERSEDYLDLLAHHAAQADDPVRAIRYLGHAAARASGAAAHRRAAALLAQAIEIADRSGDATCLPALLLRRGRALRQAAAWIDARAALERALVELPGDRTEARAEVMMELAIVALWAGGDEGARGIAEQALAMANEVGRHDLAVGALSQIALADASEGNVMEGVRGFRNALERARVHGIELRDASFEGAILNGIVLYWGALHEEGIEQSGHAIQRARELKDTGSTLLGLPHLGLALAGKGRYREAIDVFEEARRFGREYELWAPLARATAMSAGLHLELYGFEQHRELAEEARELGRSRFPPVMGFTGVDLLLNHARRGEVGAAEAMLEEVSAEVEKATAWHRWLSRGRLAFARAEIALARGDAEAALLHANRTIELARTTHRRKYEALGLHARAAAFEALERTPEAIAELERAAAIARETGDPALLFRVLSTRLSLDGNDALGAEAKLTIERIAEALPDEAMRERFLGADPVRAVLRQ